MLLRTRSTFNFNLGDDQGCHEMMSNINLTKVVNEDYPNDIINSSSTSDTVGLRILNNNPVGTSDIGVKPVFKLTDPTTLSDDIDDDVRFIEDSSFLKSCSLCRKKLSPQMDVYMYRGDQGFCSDACRCRKILIDELLEMETSTKQVLANARRRPTADVQVGVPGRRRGVHAAA